MSTHSLTVTEFLRGVNDVLVGVPALVEGELSGFAIRQERWVFFALKDETSVVECFMPAWKLRHAVEDGMVVRVAGVPQVYAKTGRFRITVEALEPVGEGSLRRAFEILKSKLITEGLFAPERKRALPRFPETIGLITSAESAAYTDFLRILRNRWGGVHVIVQDVRVQGAGAVEDIRTAFARWSHCPTPSLDVLVLIRGGGSLEDLQAFNSEEVGRAIFASSVPVVVGVGHERDVTIADLVADVRASTPSNAAELVVPDRREIASELDAMVDAWSGALALTSARCRAAVDRCLAYGHGFTRRWVATIDATTTTLARQLHGLRDRVVAQLESAERLIANLNPTRLLRRGYSMTFHRGRLVRDAHALAAGDELATRLGVGAVTSVVVRE